MFLCYIRTWRSLKRINFAVNHHINIRQNKGTEKNIVNANIFVNGHPEYDLYRLAEEYIRDTDKGISPDIPKNYFPDDDPDKEPESRWISASSLLFSNWLNYFVYQITPYEF